MGHIWPQTSTSIVDLAMVTSCCPQSWYELTIVRDNDNIAIMTSWQIKLDYDYDWPHTHTFTSSATFLWFHVAAVTHCPITIINNMGHMHLIAIMVACLDMYDQRHPLPPSHTWSHTCWLQSLHYVPVVKDGDHISITTFWQLMPDYDWPHAHRHALCR